MDTRGAGWRAAALAAFAALTAALGTPVVGPAPAAAAVPDGLDLTVAALAPMLPGQTGWVSAIWAAVKDVCDVRMTLAGTGLTVGYPGNTATFSSLYTSNALAVDNLDYSAFKITVADTVTAPVAAMVTVTYNLLPPGQLKRTDDLKTKKITCSGAKGSQTVTTTLPVAPSQGEAVIQKTVAASVPRATPTWTDLTFRGTRPNLGQFRVTLTPPAGMTVVYPADGTSAGLAGGPALPVAEDDHVSVRLDVSGMTPGVYQVPVKAAYTGGTYTGTLSVTVT